MPHRSPSRNLSGIETLKLQIDGAGGAATDSATAVQLGVTVDVLAVGRPRRPVVVLEVVVGAVAWRRHLVLRPVQEYL